jgi:hypothetical protein
LHGGPSGPWAWDLLDVDRARLLALVGECRRFPVRYRMDTQHPMRGKAPSRSARPGRGAGNFTHLDCSGFVGWILANAADFAPFLWLGSVEQREWIEARTKPGFKPSSTSACRNEDGALRIAFLRPNPRRPIGHVALVLDGSTLECCGSEGVCRRPWGRESWMNDAASLRVYVLSPPVEASARKAAAGVNLFSADEPLTLVEARAADTV